MPSALRFMPLLVPLLATGCMHTARLPRAGCEVDFQGLRLNGAPVDVIPFEVEGTRFIAEASQFNYEVKPPFQAVQSVFFLAPADAEAVLPGTPETVRAVLEGFVGTVQKVLPGTRCDAATPDASFSPVGLEQRCAVTAQEVTLSMRMRAVPAGRGLLIQVATWTSEKGKAWSDAFWRSLRVVPASAPPAGAGKVEPASPALGARLGAEILGPGSNRRRPGQG